MTPKEKAKELVDKLMPFSEANWHELATLFELQESTLLNAKECATIAVDEILNHCYEVMKPFWEEVKIEIEKL